MYLCSKAVTSKVIFFEDKLLLYGQDHLRNCKAYPKSHTKLYFGNGEFLLNTPANNLQTL